MGKRDLRAVVKADKNGKLVTRHVIEDKASGHDHKSAMPLAAPRLVASKEYSRRIAQGLVRIKDGSFTSNSLEELRSRLAAEYEEALDVHSLRELSEKVSEFTEAEKDVFEYQMPALFSTFITLQVDRSKRKTIFSGVLNNVDLFTTFYPIAFGGGHLMNTGDYACRHAQWSGQTIDDSEAGRRLHRFLLFKGIINEGHPIEEDELLENVEWFHENQQLLLSQAEAVQRREGDWEWMRELTRPDTAPSLSEGTL